MRASKREEFLRRVGQLLASQRVGVLATHYQGTPHLSLIAYVASEDLREILFVTPRYTRKVEAMGQDSRLSLLVDDRQNVASDFDACIAVTARGLAEPLPAQPVPGLLPSYLERYPHLEEFVRSPSCSIFLIRVRSYSLVSSFQKVEELSL